MRWASPVTFAVVSLLVAGCGGSQRHGFVCPVSRGHSVVTPLTGRLVALGRPPVEVRIDNRGDLRRGLVVLGLTSFRGWFALKTHFFSFRSYQGALRVRVQRIDRSGIARLGAAPTSGASLSAPAGPAAEMISGWRDWPWFTWMRSAGCYQWNISGHGFRESVVVRATAP